ncbi:MAG: hypothetical protein ACKV19_29185 [Verrucomicrobiales bacterium]
MKILLVTLAVLGLAAAAYFGLHPAKPPPAPVDPTTLHEGTLTMTMPPEEVFKRALWRRPTPDDKILHAERREWAENSSEGVAHWQWFLAVEPGPGLKSWLVEQNPFALQPAEAAALSEIKGPPEWFPTDFPSFEIQSSGSRGNLVLLWSRKGNTLFATGSGRGFTPGAPEPPTATTTTGAVTPGRLPQTPPPTSPGS